MTDVIGSRVAYGLLLLALLTAIQLVTGPVFALLVSGVLVALPILQWATVYFFWQRAIEAPEVVVLRIRTQDAVALALGSSAAAALGVIAIARVLNLIPPTGGQVFLVGIAFALLMMGWPAINWLVTWRPWAQQQEPE